MTEQIALDTNVLIYLHEPTDSEKRKIALELMASIPVISSQTVSEYLNVLRRLLKLLNKIYLGKQFLGLGLVRLPRLIFLPLKLPNILLKNMISNFSTASLSQVQYNPTAPSCTPKICTTTYW